MAFGEGIMNGMGLSAGVWRRCIRALQFLTWMKG